MAGAAGPSQRRKARELLTLKYIFRDELGERLPGILGLLLGAREYMHRNIIARGVSFGGHRQKAKWRFTTTVRNRGMGP